MSILIGADIVPTESNTQYFEEGNIKELIGDELLKIMEQADFRILNLEVPMTDSETPIVKEGPNLRASVKSVRGLNTLGVNLVTLANNHILDQGEQGLLSTIQALDKMNISHVGAGSNLLESEAPFYFKIRDKIIGVYACAEHEFSIAKEDSPGANPFEPLDTPDRIIDAKSRCDYLIVLYHGGKEYYRYPSPNLKKVCRKLVEKGADLVICQHSHCIGCMEDYLSGIIVYGQGDFLFDHNDNELGNTSLLVKVSDDGTIDYVPLKKRGNGIALATGDEADCILSEFRKRSKDIQLPGFVDFKYKEFSEKSLESYMLFFSGEKESFFFKVINKLSRYRYQKFIAHRYQKKIQTGLRNYVECEAHRELLLRGLD